MYIFCLSVHLSLDPWVASTSWLLWLRLLDTSVRVSLQDPAFNCLGYTPSSGVDCRIVSTSNFLHKPQHCFPQQLHKRCTRVPISFILANTYYLLELCLIVAILTAMNWPPIIVLICDSLISDVKHLFTCFISHLCIFFKEMSIQVHCPFLFISLYFW